MPHVRTRRPVTYDNTGLIHDEATALRLRREKLLDAGPRLVPHASLRQAKLISDWTIFLIAIDDEFDEEDLGSQAALAEVAITEVLAGSRGQPLDDQGFPRLKLPTRLAGDSTLVRPPAFGNATSRLK